MATNPTIRQISREKLLEVFKSHELVKIFEALLAGVGTTLPANIQEGLDAASAAQAAASSAAMTAKSAQSAADAAKAEADAVAAGLGSLSSQDADAVSITGGTIALASGSFGYATGNGGAVTQATSKSTGVTLNKPSGEITMSAASLAAGSSVGFTLTNSAIGAGDVMVINHVAGGANAGSYSLTPQCAAGSAQIIVRNLAASALAEAIVLRYAVVKAANA